MFRPESAAEYYAQVGSYYDENAPQFESRTCTNETHQTIRNSFREETGCYGFSTALEIGYGPGIDMLYFAERYPERQFYGIDISEGMYRQAKTRIQASGVSNADIRLGTVEDIPRLFPDKQFDLIYVFFGALNTVEDLATSAKILTEALAPGGRIVVTAINKWYLAGIMLPLMKGRFRIALQRLQPTWGGYSQTRYLASKCYTPGDIRRAFQGLRVVRKRGYSIAYPAWYQDAQRRKLGPVAGLLWKLDRLINYTPLWSKGEYLLLVLRRP